MDDFTYSTSRYHFEEIASPTVAMAHVVERYGEILERFGSHPAVRLVESLGFFELTPRFEVRRFSGPAEKAIRFDFAEVRKALSWAVGTPPHGLQGRYNELCGQTLLPVAFGAWIDTVQVDQVGRFYGSHDGSLWELGSDLFDAVDAVFEVIPGGRIFVEGGSGPTPMESPDRSEFGLVPTVDGLVGLLELRSDQARRGLDCFVGGEVVPGREEWRAILSGAWQRALTVAPPEQALGWGRVFIKAKSLLHIAGMGDLFGDDWKQESELRRDLIVRFGADPDYGLPGSADCLPGRRDFLVDAAARVTSGWDQASSEERERVTLIAGRVPPLADLVERGLVRALPIRSGWIDWWRENRELFPPEENWWD